MEILENNIPEQQFKNFLGEVFESEETSFPSRGDISDLKKKLGNKLVEEGG